MAQEPNPTAIKAVVLKQQGLKQKEIAATLGVCRQTAAKHLKAAEKAETEALKAYAMQFGALMPIEDRARRYVELASQNEQQMVALKTLERIDWLDGIRPERESQQNQQNAPAFVLPAGVNVAMMIGPASDRSRDTAPEQHPQPTDSATDE